MATLMLDPAVIDAVVATSLAGATRRTAVPAVSPPTRADLPTTPPPRR
jgi:hypothetical protein